MNIVKKALIGFVAIEHIYILILEMFLWTKPRGLKTFDMTLELAESSKVLAANQGLYNGFLAAGLLWGLFHSDKKIGFQIQVFFLACVVIAGLFGGITAKTSIIYMQAMPALITLIVVLMNRK